ncbi:MAG: MFS transporter [Alphaproteobacteria bacterium]|nr:MFS transporter [Alphaproteobacteria bacterium]MBU1525168.1 MFS transporter [Alphaproteobacteria bacterium]MBU2117478.1 MFS transporter [Alphaproteobacteria bacterium]MBU2352164.1 MFS transporter [Alphaproteobacteria bacterium]MBU2381174.1 MFS transporter [Alphaproteobacteria bacterium]
MTMDPGRSRLSLLRGTAYASGNFAKSLIWNATELALLFTFTDLMGIPAAAAGLIILATLVWDALLDPFVGGLADRTGRFVPFVWRSAPLLGLSFAGLFASPALGLGSAATAAVALLVLRTAYSLVDVPHNALIARIACTAHDRSLLAGARFAFSAAATFLLGLTLPAILALEPAARARDALAVWAVAMAAAATAVLMLSAWAASPFDRAGPGPSPPGKTAPLGHLVSALRLGRVQTVLVLACLGNGLTALVAKSTLYLADQVYGDPTLAGGAIMALAVGQVAGMPLWIWLSRRWGVRLALVTAHGVAGTCALPLLAGDGLSPHLFLFVIGLYGVGAGGVFTLIWTLTSEAADAGPGVPGASGGAIFGLVIMAMQIASGVGSGLMALGLSVAGYSPDTRGSPEVLTALAGFMIAPASAALATAWILRGSRGRCDPKSPPP